MNVLIHLSLSSSILVDCSIHGESCPHLDVVHGYTCYDWPVASNDFIHCKCQGEIHHQSCFLAVKCQKCFADPSGGVYTAPTDPITGLGGGEGARVRREKGCHVHWDRSGLENHQNCCQEMSYFKDKCTKLYLSWISATNPIGELTVLPQASC